MKRFLKKFCVFLIFPLLVFIILHCYFINIKTSYSEKLDGIKLIEHLDAMFLGNSHANYAIDPCSFDDFSVYNLANVSQQIYFDKRLIINLIEQKKTLPKYIFISVDYHSLFTISQGSLRDNFSFYEYGIKLEDRNYFFDNLSPLFAFNPSVFINLIKKNILLKKDNKALIQAIDIEDHVNRYYPICKGFMGIKGTKKSSFNISTYQRRVKRYSFDKEEEIKKRNIVYKDLNEFILYIKNKGVTPILFSSPTYSSYNRYLKKDVIERNLFSINKLCDKFNIQYWRYNEHSDFEKSDFYNQDHLNSKGAEKFSKMLNDRLLQVESSY